MNFKNLAPLRRELQHKSYGIQWHIIAQYIIAEALGSEWLEKNVSASARRAAPFNQEIDEATYAIEYHLRCVRLGHMLFLLKDSPGFGNLLADAKTRDFEPVFFEMYAASLLASNGYSVRFVCSTGVKGQDYDLQAEVDGQLVAVEVKTRRGGLIEDTTTLKNTLRKAKKQLPTDTPSIICIALSTEYKDSDSGQHTKGEIENAIADFLHGTKQINGVFAFWNTWEGEPLQCTTQVTEYRNHEARNYLGRPWLIAPQKTPVAAKIQNSFPSFML